MIKYKIMEGNFNVGKNTLTALTKFKPSPSWERIEWEGQREREEREEKSKGGGRRVTEAVREGKERELLRKKGGSKVEREVGETEKGRGDIEDEKERYT